MPPKQHEGAGTPLWECISKLGSVRIVRHRCNIHSRSHPAKAKPAGLGADATQSDARNAGMAPPRQARGGCHKRSMRANTTKVADLTPPRPGLPDQGWMPERQHEGRYHRSSMRVDVTKPAGLIPQARPQGDATEAAGLTLPGPGLQGQGLVPHRQHEGAGRRLEALFSKLGSMCVVAAGTSHPRIMRSRLDPAKARAGRTVADAVNSASRRTGCQRWEGYRRSKVRACC